MSSTSANATDYCKRILAINSKIRFAGKIVGDKMISTARKDRVIPLLDKDLAALSHHQVSVKAMMDRMFTDKLGKTVGL